MLTPKLPTIFTIEVNGQGKNPTRTEVKARDHLIIIDEPVERGGNDEAASPLETMLSSYLACLNVITHITANAMGISIDKIAFRLTAQLDSRGIFGLVNIKVPFPKIELAVTLTTHASKNEVKALQEAVATRCPISVILREAGTNIQEQWVITPNNSIN